MFLFTQILIALITFAVLNATHYLLPAAIVFFVAMQLSALYGAMWAARIKRRIEATTLSHNEVR